MRGGRNIATYMLYVNMQLETDILDINSFNTSMNTLFTYSMGFHLSCYSTTCSYYNYKDFQQKWTTCVK